MERNKPEFKISYVITNYDPDISFLPLCFEAASRQADEVIVISSKKSTLAEKINQGFKMSRGNYIIISNDDAILKEGKLEDLCDPKAVTAPLINGSSKGFHAHLFCVPRWVFEKTGGYDEQYEHAYFDDDDFLANLNQNNIPTKVVDTVNFSHPPVGGSTLHKINDRDGFFERNRQRFIEKWGRTP
jgi:GT2 family glycosyltransferase